MNAPESTKFSKHDCKNDRGQMKFGSNTKTRTYLRNRNIVMKLPKSEYCDETQDHEKKTKPFKSYDHETNEHTNTWKQTWISMIDLMKMIEKRTLQWKYENKYQQRNQKNPGKEKRIQSTKNVPVEKIRCEQTTNQNVKWWKHAGIKRRKKCTFK